MKLSDYLWLKNIMMEQNQSSTGACKAKPGLSCTDQNPLDDAVGKLLQGNNLNLK